MGVLTVCARCHRPLKNPAINGMGPVCARAVAPVADVECDLFGYDIEAAALAARARLAEFIDFRTWHAQHAIAEGFRDARKRFVWVRP